MRGGAVVARWAHNPKAVGSNPAPATTKVESFWLSLFFMHWLYIIHSPSADKYYVGSSSNPEGRLLAHNHPQNKGFTRRYQPWEIVFKQEYPSKHEAETAERKIKSFKSRKIIERIIKAGK